jgi:CBS domain-containing protein
MRVDVPPMHPDESLAQAAELMHGADVRALPIVQRGVVMGILIEDRPRSLPRPGRVTGAHPQKLVDACREHDLKQSEVEVWMERFGAACEREPLDGDAGEPRTREYAPRVSAFFSP